MSSPPLDRVAQYSALLSERNKQREIDRELLLERKREAEERREKTQSLIQSKRETIDKSLDLLRSRVESINILSSDAKRSLERAHETTAKHVKILSDMRIAEARLRKVNGSKKT